MRNAQWAMMAAVVACLAFGDDARLAASPVKSDEEVIVFPVSAAMRPDGTWNIPAHVWVFEHDDWSASNGLVRSVAGQLGIEDIGDKAATFTDRATWFTVDNEGSKQVTLEMAGEHWALDDTGANGHSRTGVVYHGPAPSGARSTLAVRLKDGDNRRFQGAVEFIPPAGVTVISDIDDTIKISNVLDKEALLANTFLEPHVATPGMPELYETLKARGSHFHYVSASPWQLWPSLKPFIARHYPEGTVAMRHFRLKDGSFADFLVKPSGGFKLAAISSIINRYPGHKFILIGDSGECDPEIYGEIYRKFPGKIDRIMVRKVTGSDFANGRMAAALNGVPQNDWELIGGDAVAGDKTCQDAYRRE